MFYRFEKQRLIPGGRIEVIFNFGAPISWMINQHDEIAGVLKSDIGVMGQRNKIYYAASVGPIHLMGVRFNPGGLAAFTNVPANNLLNKLLTAEDVFGSLMNQWKEKIVEKKSDEEKIFLFDLLILSALRKKPAELVAMNHMIESIRTMDEPVSISNFCQQTGWNYKKLERSFLKFTGYSPKQYSSIIRFNKALRQIDQNGESITAIGLDNGYYDQSHFIKDCIRLIGITPGRLQSDENIISNLLVKYQPV